MSEEEAQAILQMFRECVSPAIHIKQFCEDLDVLDVKTRTMVALAYVDGISRGISTMTSADCFPVECFRGPIKKMILKELNLINNDMNECVSGILSEVAINKAKEKT